MLGMTVLQEAFDEGECGVGDVGPAVVEDQECPPGRRIVVIMLPTEASVDPADDALSSAKYGRAYNPMVS
jgi:hypothetical protein